MIDDLLYENFLTLSNTKKMDYLYIYLIEKDKKKLEKKYGPRKVEVIIDDFEVTIKCNRLSDARSVKENLIMEGMILVDEEYYKSKSGDYVVSYLYEGTTQPICLN